jgi:hypothetical protein
MICDNQEISVMENSSSVANARDALGRHAIQALVLALVFSVAAVWETLTPSSLHNPDIWRHLRIGSWILANRAWPQGGLFSQSAGSPWRDFSWGYDVLAAIAYQFLQLRAVPALLLSFRVALAVITFFLAGGQRNFWIAVGFSAVVQYVLGGFGPTSEFCSVVFLGVELILIQKTRTSGDSRWMYFVPALFLFWANLDIGFVYGIFVFLLFVLCLSIESYGTARDWSLVQKTGAQVSVKTAAVTALACLAASLVSPYGYHAYPAFFADQGDTMNVNIPGYAAMGFHRGQDYVLLLLTMSAFTALGVFRSRQPFPLSLLIACTILGFHAERAGWLVALASLFVIGEIFSEANQNSAQYVRNWSWQLTTATAILAILVCGTFFFVRVPSSNEVLLARVADQFPIRACNYIRQHDLPRPVFNADEWGSFLTWYLPEYPVAIDSRRGLYSEEQESGYAKVMKADMRYQDFAPMREAQTLLIEKNSVMGEALRGLPGFQVAYEDVLAIVFLQQAKE